MKRSRLLGLGFGLLGLLAASAGRAQVLDEAEIKAAFIYNFVQFTVWPPGSVGDMSPVPVCARQDGPIAQKLTDIAGRKGTGRAIALRPLPADLARNCAVIVVDQNDHAWLAAVAAVLPGTPALLVADDNAGKLGGMMISLSLSGRKVVFDIDLARVRAAGLGLSSRVMQLARNVK